MCVHALLSLQVVSCEPMDPEEAIYSLEAVGHDFYVYRDKASSELRVRREGHGSGMYSVAACAAVRPCQGGRPAAVDAQAEAAARLRGLVMPAAAILLPGASRVRAPFLVCKGGTPHSATKAGLPDRCPCTSAKMTCSLLSSVPAACCLYPVSDVLHCCSAWADLCLLLLPPMLAGDVQA